MSLLQFTLEMDSEDLARQLSDDLSRDEILSLIKRLDELAEDWDFTKELHRHFVALHREWKQEIAAEKRMNRK